MNLTRSWRSKSNWFLDRSNLTFPPWLIASTAWDWTVPRFHGSIKVALPYLSTIFFLLTDPPWIYSVFIEQKAWPDWSGCRNMENSFWKLSSIIILFACIPLIHLKIFSNYFIKSWMIDRWIVTHLEKCAHYDLNLWIKIWLLN